MPINIHIAKTHGFCGNEKFGVEGSIQTAINAQKAHPGQVYMLGDIVHNEHVVKRLLEEHQIKTVYKMDDIPNGAVIVLRAHGSTPQVFAQAKAKNLTIYDATCPIVTHSHKEVLRFAAEGKKIIYIASQLDHDEAIGVKGQAPDSVILTTLDTVLDLEIDPTISVVMTQTTLSKLEVDRIKTKLKEKYPNLEFRPGLCYATTSRQNDIIELAKQYNFVIVVGHPTSSNSNRLKDVALDVGAESYIVDTPDELNPDWFNGKTDVGISSGASTPEWLLNDVIAKIKEITE